MSKKQPCTKQLIFCWGGGQQRGLAKKIKDQQDIMRYDKKRGGTKDEKNKKKEESNDDEKKYEKV